MKRELVDAAVSELRHDLRNRFAAIHNAAFYIRKKVQRAGLDETDARLLRFFDLIAAELEASDRMITTRLTTAALLEATAPPVTAVDALVHKGS